MREGGDRFRFALEAPESDGIVGDRGRDDLDRDIPSEPRIAGAIDLAHASGAERGQDFVGTEARASGQSHDDGIIRAVAQEPLSLSTQQPPGTSNQD